MTPEPETPYRFATLWPVRHPRAAENVAFLGPRTLGIEVTEPELAAACGLGNIDPQHSPAAKVNLSAIEAALVAPLPPDGATLVTIRPDADAFGAMAVLLLRRKGLFQRGWPMRRIRAIGRADRFDHGGWQEWRAHHPELASKATLRELGGEPLRIAMLAAIANDHGASVESRVLRIARWIRNGETDGKALSEAFGFRRGLLSSWNRGEIKVEPVLEGRAAMLRANHPGALRAIGYRYAPVVVAEGRLGEMRKLTVAQFEPGWVDLSTLRDRLWTLEPGWGGSATILGSPQGTSSRLVVDQLLSVLGPLLLH